MSNPEIASDGTKRWFNSEGKLDRLDGPALERANGTKSWWKDGEFHRLDGPALERANGTKYWYKEGKLHRLEGPAVEYADGTKYWYKDGLLHCLEGPAVERADGYKAWYKDGIKVEPFPTKEKADILVGTLMIFEGESYRLELPREKLIELAGKKYSLVKI